MEGLEEDSIGAGTSKAIHDELTEDNLLLKSRLHSLSLKLNFKRRVDVKQTRGSLSQELKATSERHVFNTPELLGPCRN